MKLHRSFVLFIFLVSVGFDDFEAISQNTFSGDPFLVPTIGITWRSTIMNYFDFKSVYPSDMQMAYSYERNVQGFSVNPGIQYGISKSLILEYHPNLRYDVTHTTTRKKDWKIISVTLDKEDTTYANQNPVYEKSFLLDHNFNVIKRMKKLDLGVGLTVVNFGKTIRYSLNDFVKNPEFRTQNIQFTTYNGFVAFPIKKIYVLELKAMYIPRGFPYNVFEKYMTYSIRAYYRFEKRNVVERRRMR